MVWFDVDGARHYLAQQQGSSVPSRKVIYRMVEQGLKVARAAGRPEAKRGGTRMFFTSHWIDEFLVARATLNGEDVGVTARRPEEVS